MAISIRRLIMCLVLAFSSFTKLSGVFPGLVESIVEL